MMKTFVIVLAISAAITGCTQPRGPRTSVAKLSIRVAGFVEASGIT